MTPRVMNIATLSSTYYIYKNCVPNIVESFLRKLERVGSSGAGLASALAPRLRTGYPAVGLEIFRFSEINKHFVGNPGKYLSTYMSRNLLLQSHYYFLVVLTA